MGHAPRSRGNATARVFTCPDAFRPCDIARQVQAALLPRACANCPGVQVAARYQMSAGIGGDLHDFVQGPGDGYALVIGDILGHELFSSLVMSLIIGAIRAAGAKAETPLEVLSLVNNLLCALNDQMRLTPVTCSLFLGLVAPNRRRMVYVNAGHPPPVAWHQDGTMKELAGTAPLLGIRRGLHDDEVVLDLKTMDRLLLYTDGVSEAHDSAGRFFDTRGIINTMASCHHLGVAAGADHMLDRVLAFTGDRPQDDITLVLADFQWTRTA